MEINFTNKKESFTEEIFTENHNRWKEEDILKLAHHFHKYEGETEQFLRVKSFTMAEEDVKEFNKLKQIEYINIYMTLKEGYRKMFTFFPILKVSAGGSEKFYELHPKTKEESKIATSNSEIVPEIFKEMVCKNWDEIDISLIDDLFMTKQQLRMERVHFYIVDGKIINFINKELLKNIKEIILYPGIDMNKFQYKDKVSFTPVLGFTLIEPKEYGPGLAGFLEAKSDDKIYAEYLTPCPPTCP